MSILEAWSYQVPTIMTEECNLPEGFESNSAIKINHDINYSINKLIDFLNSDEKKLKKWGAMQDN